MLCLTSVNFAIDSVKRSLRATSTALLGGDGVVIAGEPIKLEVKNLVSAMKLESSNTLNFFSMLSTNEDIVLVSVKAIESNYPLRGQMASKPNLRLPQPGTIWLDPRAMLMLKAKVGDQITLGDKKMVVGAELISGPDLSLSSFGFAPRAIMLQQDLAGTNVLGAGSRVTYKLFVAANGKQASDFTQKIKDILPASYTYQDLQTQDKFSTTAIDKTEKYLGLAVLVNIIIAATVIGIAINLFCTKHIQDVAIIRCLGAKVTQIQSSYFKSLLIMALILGVVGSGLGFLLQQLAAWWLGNNMHIDFPLPGWQPCGLGVMCALLLIIGIGVPQLFNLSKVRPLQILRQDNSYQENSNLSQWYTLSAVIFGLLLYFQVPDLKILIAILSGLGLIVAGTLLGAWLMFNIFQLIRGGLPAILRLSITNIIANAKNNILQVLTFSLVIGVALLLYIIRIDLVTTWQDKIPQGAPNYFAINIFPQDVQRIKQYFSQHNIPISNFYPIVRGVLYKINQQPVSINEDESDKRTGVNRPLNLTWTNQLPPDNKILSGKWFAADSLNKQQISIESSIANRLGIGLGDELTFLISMQEITAKVTSIRSVQWDSFNPNFYIIYPAGLLDQFVPSYMTSFFVPTEQLWLIREFAYQFPEINLLSVSAMLAQAKEIFSLVIIVIGYIWFNTMLVGMSLLLAVVLASINVRLVQNNILRILGASKSQLQAILSIEFILLGTLSGLLGTMMAICIARYLANSAFDLSYAPSLWFWLWGPLFGCLSMFLGGIFAANRVFKATPIQLSQNLN